MKKKTNQNFFSVAPMNNVTVTMGSRDRLRRN